MCLAHMEYFGQQCESAFQKATMTNRVFLHFRKGSPIRGLLIAPDLLQHLLNLLNKKYLLSKIECYGLNIWKENHISFLVKMLT